MTIIFFFFSSRRRHTSWPRDWSSDVCSSDLTVRGLFGERVAAIPRSHKDAKTRLQEWLQARSEERRVGKECRSGGKAEDSIIETEIRTLFTACVSQNKQYYIIP